MPTYRYINDATSEVFEVFQLMRDLPLTEIDGIPCHRIPCVGQKHRDKSFKPYISNQLPHTMQGPKKVTQNGRKKLYIDTPRTEKNLMARYSLTRDAAQNDD